MNANGELVLTDLLKSVPVQVAEGRSQQGRKLEWDVAAPFN